MHLPSLGLFLAAAGVGCGGKVVVDSLAETSGGTSGSGGAPSSSTVAASSSTVAASSSTGTVRDACTAKCDAQASLGCPVPPDCAVSCQEVVAGAGGCSAELAAYYECFAEHAAGELGSCGIPASCQAQFADYIGCGDAKCYTDQCGSSAEVDCNCTGFCGGHTVHAVCKDGVCSCLADSTEVGTCSDGSIPICGLKETCCIVFFPDD